MFTPEGCARDGCFRMVAGVRRSLSGKRRSGGSGSSDLEGDDLELGGGYGASVWAVGSSWSSFPFRARSQTADVDEEEAEGDYLGGFRCGLSLIHI